MRKNSTSKNNVKNAEITASTCIESKPSKPSIQKIGYLSVFLELIKNVYIDL